MTDFEGQVLADLSVLKSQMHSLLGIGEPGRLNAIEHRVEKYERSLQRMKGMAGAGSIVLTLVHIGIDYFRH
jgi:hypothetical protein